MPEQPNPVLFPSFTPFDVVPRSQVEEQRTRREAVRGAKRAGPGDRNESWQAIALL